MKFQKLNTITKLHTIFGYSGILTVRK